MAAPKTIAEKTVEHCVYSHITKVPGVCGGRACIDGTRIRVLNIPSLNLAQVYAGLSYYYEISEEIEAFIAEDEKVGREA